MIQSTLKILRKGKRSTVYRMHTKKDGIKTPYLLKISKVELADNLVYEYLVGQYINTLCPYLPCFIQTHNMYRVDGPLKTLQTSLIPIEPKLLYGCKYANHLALINEYVPGETLEYHLYQPNMPLQFIRHDLVLILFQVYVCLKYLKNKYTHYDLHLNNIMIVELDIPRQFEYKGYTPFICKYLVKIIDYGRNYFKDSPDIYRSLCKIKECEPDCGYTKGFSWLSNYNIGTRWFITSSRPNISHDLRLAEGISQIPHIDPVLKNILKTGFKYGSTSKTPLGTVEIVRSGLPYTINNIIDMADTLARFIRTDSFQYNNRTYYPETYSIFHIPFNQPFYISL
jgi:hypothetical protein